MLSERLRSSRFRRIRCLRWGHTWSCRREDKQMRVPLLFAAVFVTAASAQQPSDTSHLQKRVIQLPGSLPGLPFSSAVRVGNVLYLSGAIGVLPGTVLMLSSVCWVWFTTPVSTS